MQADTSNENPGGVLTLEGRWLQTRRHRTERSQPPPPTGGVVLPASRAPASKKNPLTLYQLGSCAINTHSNVITHSRGRPQEEHPDGPPLLVRMLGASLRPGGTQGGIIHGRHSASPCRQGGGRGHVQWPIRRGGVEGLFVEVGHWQAPLWSF